MSEKIDFSIATSEHIQNFLCKQLLSIRLARNITRVQLAKESGIHPNTIKLLEQGQGVSLDTFIRVMIALRLQDNFKTLLPDPSVWPVERVNFGRTQRQRARPIQSNRKNAPWAWGDETDIQK